VILENLHASIMFLYCTHKSISVSFIVSILCWALWCTNEWNKGIYYVIVCIVDYNFFPSCLMIHTAPMHHVQQNFYRMIYLFIVYFVTPSVTQDYTVPTDQMAMNNVVNRWQINAVIAQFETEYQRSCEGTEKNHKSVS